MILDIFTYFAQFPLQSGVLKMFNAGSSTHEAYATLKTAVKALPLKERIPGITDYVFGQSYETVKGYVDGLVDSTYLFVDFGEISSSRDSRNSIQDRFHLAVTIARKISTTADLVEQAIVTDQTLALMDELQACMLADQQPHPWLKEINYTITISPFTSSELSSLGWSMVFYREGADMRNIKDKVNTHLQNQ